MNRITTSGELPDGKDFTVVVTPRHIVVRVGDRLCTAHNRWISTDEARGLLESIAIALQPPPTAPPLHAPQQESDIPSLVGRLRESVEAAKERRLAQTNLSLNPECQQGKHPNCDGNALHPDGSIGPCECPHHG